MMKHFVLIFLFVTVSCQDSYSLGDWFSLLKNETLTELASQTSKGTLTQEERDQVLLLFLKIEKTQNCSQLVSLLENDDLLVYYEEKYNLNKGFVFDLFNGLTYEVFILSALNLNREAEWLAWIIANTWQSYFSTERVNAVLNDITHCYPY